MKTKRFSVDQTHFNAISLSLHPVLSKFNSSTASRGSGLPDVGCHQVTIKSVSSDFMHMVLAAYSPPGSFFIFHLKIVSANVWFQKPSVLLWVFAIKNHVLRQQEKMKCKAYWNGRHPKSNRRVKHVHVLQLALRLGIIIYEVFSTVFAVGVSNKLRKFDSLSRRMMILLCFLAVPSSQKPILISLFYQSPHPSTSVHFCH